MFLCWIIGHKLHIPTEKTLGIFPQTPFCTRCGQYIGSSKKKIEVDETDDDANRTAEMAGALKARDVLNREMGIDSRATGAYLIDRYDEIKD